VEAARFERISGLTGHVDYESAAHRRAGSSPEQPLVAGGAMPVKSHIPACHAVQ
jgi:hypothetical protein